MRKIDALILVASWTVLASCTGTNGETTKSDDQGLIKVDTSQSAGLSKYSPRQSYSRGAEHDMEVILNPSKDLPSQSIYSIGGSRSHLIDHFLANQPPEFIPLTSWKNDFIAGELALDALDLEEAKKMFTLSLGAAEKTSSSDQSKQKALSLARLGVSAYYSKNYADADKFLEQSLEVLQKLSESDADCAKALDVSLFQLALIKAKSGDLGAAGTYLEKRLEQAEKVHSKFSPSIMAALNDFGNILFYQRKFKEADEAYARAALLATRFTKGTDYRLMAFYNLANCRFEEARYADALELYKLCQDRTSSTRERLAQCAVKLSSLPSEQKIATDLPPPLGSSEVFAKLIDASKFLLRGTNTWGTKTVLEAALDEANAMEEGKDLARSKVLAFYGDLCVKENNLSAAKDKYLEALPLLRKRTDGDAKAQTASVLASLLVCQLSSKDESASKTFAELKSNASKNTWEELSLSLNEAFNKRQLYGDNNGRNEVLISVSQICQQETNRTNSFLRALVLANLGRAYARNDTTLCSKSLAEAFSVLKRLGEADNPNAFDLELSCAYLLMAIHDFSNCQDYFRLALPFAQKSPGENNKRLLSAIDLGIGLYNNWKMPDEEEALIVQKTKVLASSEISPEYAKNEEGNMLSSLARIAKDKGDVDKSIEFLEKLLKLTGDDASRQSNLRELIAINERAGRWENVSQYHQRIAKLLPQQSGQEWDKELFDAAIYAARAGKYADSVKLIESVIADMESRGDTKIIDSGCYQNEPNYPACLNVLATSLVDGEGNYDKAMTVFNKRLKALGFDSESKNPSAPSGPGCAPMRRVPSGIIPSSKPVLSTDDACNLFICATALGDKAKSENYASKLKSRLEAAGKRSQAATSPVASNSYTNDCLSLISKGKLSKPEEMRLMSSIVAALNPPQTYSGRVEGRSLIERSICWQEQNSNKQNLASDYATFVQVLLVNRNFSDAEPWATRRIGLLKNTNADKNSLAIASIDLAQIAQEQGQYFRAAVLYKEAIPSVAAKDAKFRACKNLSYCYQMQGLLSDAEKSAKEALLSASNTAESNEMHVVLGVLADLRGNDAAATKEYQQVKPDEKDAYAAFEPLRRAADYAAQEKQLEMGDKLYKRQVSLLPASPANAVGISNAYTQLGRMYKWNNKGDKARAAFDLAISALKTNPSDSFCQSQITSIKQEMAQLH